EQPHEYRPPLLATGADVARGRASGNRTRVAAPRGRRANHRQLVVEHHANPPPLACPAGELANGSILPSPAPPVNQSAGAGRGPGFSGAGNLRLTLAGSFRRQASRTQALTDSPLRSASDSMAAHHSA